MWLFIGKNEIDKELLKKWKNVLNELQRTKDKKFKPKWKYGYSQIVKEFACQKIWNGSVNKKGEHILEDKYPELVNSITYFKNYLKFYYGKYILPKLFKYELLK